MVVDLGIFGAEHGGQPAFGHFENLALSPHAGQRDDRLRRWPCVRSNTRADPGADEGDGSCTGVGANVGVGANANERASACVGASVLAAADTELSAFSQNAR